MSITFDDEYESENTPLDPNIREQLKRADKDRKARAEAEHRAQQAERQLALIKAGIAAEGPGELFHKAYDGPLDTDAIRAEAQKYGLWNEPQGHPQQSQQPVTQEQYFQDQQVQAELNALQHQQQALAGPYGNAVAPDPAQELLAKVKAASSADEVMELMARAEQEHPELNIYTSRSARN